MKKVFYPLACCLIGGALASCGGGNKSNAQATDEAAPTTVALSYSKSLKAPETDTLNLPVDKDGYITIFDGKTFHEFMRDKEEDEIEKLLSEGKKGNEDKKDSSKVDKKPETVVLDLDNRDDRTVRLTGLSGRMGDHYLMQDGSRLFYTVRLEKTMDLCVLDIKDRSTSVLVKNVYGSLYPDSRGRKPAAAGG